MKKKKSPKCLEFEALFVYWMRKLRVKVLPIKPDRRLTCDCMVSCGGRWGKNPEYIQYNPVRIAKKTRCKLISLIFHEIGHMKHQFPYGTHEQKVYSERQAEKYCLRCLKRFYPGYYEENIYNETKKDRKTYWHKVDKAHGEAYDSIEEYNIQD